MRLPHLPASVTRFFARSTAGWLECPRCGKVLYYQSTRPVRKRSNCSWDSRTARIRCPVCGLVGVLGTIFWPVQGGGTNCGRTAPLDQVPGERELVQLRAMGGEGAGWWMPAGWAVKPFRPEHTNITAKCLCREGEEDHPDCPIHGWVPDVRLQTNTDPWPR